MDLLKKFIDFIKTKHLFNKNDRLLLAVSGGIDSSVLCHLCKQAGFDFFLAHCNFQLRGEESKRDEDFVQSLGKKYRVEVYIKRFNTTDYAEQHKLSIQVAARQLRYDWLYELAGRMTTDNEPQATVQSPTPKLQTNAYILTAHHANDNIETVLMNFFKGTGIQGLKGIEAKSGKGNKLVRPLLFATKKDIKKYADEHQLQYAEDSSNATEKYTRNYFRNQLIPAIQKVFPQVEDNLLNNIKRFTDIDILYRQSVEQYKKKLIVKKDNEIHIPVLKLLQIEAVHTVLYEIVKDFGFSSGQVQDVVQLLHSDSGKYVQSSSHKILKNRNWLIISPIQLSLAKHILIEKPDDIIEFEEGKLTFNIIQKGSFKLLQDNNIVQLDAGKIQFPLLLRKWKQGDYFYPLGMLKKKKLSKFFIDKKISLTDKEKIWVLEMDKKIIWIIGHRIDERFKITPATKNILKIDLALT